jgi:MarR family transcriptional regulator, lower aerobic nicotinate degradation pathway regulator
VRADRTPAVIPAPSDGDLGLVDALAQLTFTVQGALARVVADHDMSIVQARLLGILRDRTPTIKELAGFLQLDKSSVTGLVDRAERRGLVRRVKSSLDGRSIQVVITPTGRDLVTRATEAFANEMADLVAGLSTTQRRILSTTATIVVATDADRRGIDLFGPR